LLTDADIAHAPETLTRLVAFAESHGLAMVSLMARLDARGFWGGLLIPAFVFFFQKLYPFPLVNRPGHHMAAAAGGCMLIRRDVLMARGGIAAIREALIDDCALGALIKRGPPAAPIWLGLADREVVSLRDNRSLGSIWTMVARTAFTQLRHSWLLLAGTVVAMAVIYLGPPVVLAVGLATASPAWIACGAAACGAMGLAYAPTLNLYGRGVWQAVFLPLAALLYTAMTFSSAVRHLQGSGGQWKGRTYP
jgi:hopene-associated glycosyltransferase HpnB